MHNYFFIIQCKLRKSKVNFNVRTSIGTSKEIAIANEYNIPVIGLNENDLELHPWDINDCRRIFTDKEKLIDYVHKFYLN